MILRNDVTKLYTLEFGIIRGEYHFWLHDKDTSTGVKKQLPAFHFRTSNHKYLLPYFECLTQMIVDYENKEQ